MVFGDATYCLIMWRTVRKSCAELCWKAGVQSSRRRMRPQSHPWSQTAATRPNGGSCATQPLMKCGSNGIHRCSGSQPFIFVSEFGDLEKGVHAIAFQTMNLK
jgi:hypothetical protein